MNCSVEPVRLVNTFNPFTAKYPSLELIITKIFAQKIVGKLPKSKIFPRFRRKKAFYENFEENIPNVGTVPRM